MTVQIVPSVGNTGTWDLKIGPEGTSDFGRLPAIGEFLPHGRYLLSVRDRETLRFTYATTLEGLAKDSLCIPVS